MKNINVIYEESYKIPLKDVFNLISNWLNERYAKIEKSNPPITIEAIHGSIDEEDIYNPNYLKKINVQIKQYNQNSVKVLIEVINSAKFLQTQKLYEILRETFFIFLFQNLENFEKELLNPEKKGDKVKSLEDIVSQYDEEFLMNELDRLYKEWDEQKQKKSN